MKTKDKYIAVKKSSYNKLKEKNEQLLDDISVLVRKKGSFDAQVIEAQYSFLFGVQDMVWFGSPNGYDNHAPQMAKTPCCVCGKDIDINICQSKHSLCVKYDITTNSCRAEKCVGEKIKLCAVCSDKCQSEFELQKTKKS